MKVCILAVLVAILGVALAFTDLRDGRPACTSDVEMRVLYYRNLWDPTAYWKCQSRNVAAVAQRCTEGAFQDRLKRCVSWDDWEWEDIVAPPSRAQ